MGVFWERFGNVLWRIMGLFCGTILGESWEYSGIGIGTMGFLSSRDQVGLRGIEILGVGFGVFFWGLRRWFFWELF